MHVYTFRNEDQFLLWNYGADPYREYEQFLKLDIDGYFTDFPWSLSHYMELLKAQNNGAATQACASPFLVMSITIIFLFFTWKQGIKYRKIDKWFANSRRSS